MVVDQVQMVVAPETPRARLVPLAGVELGYLVALLVLSTRPDGGGVRSQSSQSMRGRGARHCQRILLNALGLERILLLPCPPQSMLLGADVKRKPGRKDR